MQNELTTQNLPSPPLPLCEITSLVYLSPLIVINIVYNCHCDILTTAMMVNSLSTLCQSHFKLINVNVRVDLNMFKMDYL